MKKSTFFKDFKEFISKGNIIDMAVGVVIGGAFGKIVSSLVADIITPLIGLLTGGVNLAEKYAVISTPAALEGAALPPTATEATELGYGVLTWGNFIQSIIDFLLVALAIFIVLRIIVKAKNKVEAKKIAAAEAKAAEDKAKADAEAAAAKEAADALAKRDADEAASTMRQEELLKEIRDLLKKQ